MTADTAETQARPRSPVTLALFAILSLLLIAALLALGIWQIHRLSWKLDLIARVDARVHAEPVTPPSSAEWSQINAAEDEYRRVRISGTFENDRESKVYAATALGAGYWVLTPLRTVDGSEILINRGFVPTDKRDAATRPQGQVSGETTVTGLMRMTEPKGSLLRSNDPAVDRWYSRDVEAIARARGLTNVAPYFIDADATPNPGNLPVGGLTQLVFPNNHLVYAITWFALALMVTGGSIYVAWDEWRLRRNRMN